MPLFLGTTVAFGQISLGAKGSLQFANVRFSGSGVTLETGNITGFQAGLMLSAPISDGLSVRPQLLYSGKGYVFPGSTLGGTSADDLKLTINYLEVPIQLAYSLEVGDGNLVIGAGPYLAYALGGKGTGTVNGKAVSESLDFNDPDSPKRFDFGLTLSAGYELISGLGLSAYYSPGLANIANSASTPNLSTKNTAFGISVGYFFGSRN